MTVETTRSLGRSSGRKRHRRSPSRAAGTTFGGRAGFERDLFGDAGPTDVEAARLEILARAGPFETAAKRIVDIAVAATALALTLPLLLAAAALIRMTSRGPVLFRQIRIGRGEVPFTMLKLRTMRADADDKAHREFNTRELRGELDRATADEVFKIQDSRITPVGRYLRRYSIDELPQLLNVLAGDMSLVGPRPSLPWEVELYTSEQRLRHCCPPGMTGLWQVSGRNRLSMPEMLALDVAYARSRSLTLDLRILLRTPYAILFEQNTR